MAGSAKPPAEATVRSQGGRSPVPGAVAGRCAAAAGADKVGNWKTMGWRIIGHGQGWIAVAAAGKVLIIRVEIY